ncbi:hypothetical protein [Mycobacterium sp.]|uniref:hypothetical protein n=1 Tax=Mycobacterium sp. TaxID=1785 RepID=UPI003F99C569
MDNDPCAARTYWSTISAASADSTLAGLLAGLLIAAAAALLIQWYQGAAPPTIALFGSGVPALTLSTYLFTVIAGVHYPTNIDYTTRGGLGDILCSQVWSNWLLAIGLLWIGAAIVVCGLGWALVSYADNLAVKLCKRNTPIDQIEDRRKAFIRLNALLSGAAITGATALFIVSSVVYLKGTGSQDYSREFLGVKWYLLFFIYLGGLYLIGRSSYAVFRRTVSALRANKNSCDAYAPGGPPVATDDEGIKAGGGPVRPPAAKDPRFARRKKLAKRAAQEFAGVIWVAFCAFLAVYMTSGKAFHQQRWPVDLMTVITIVIYVAVFYVIVRAIYVIIVPRINVIIARIVERVSAKKDDAPAVPAANTKPVERIRIDYDRGWLREATYGVVVLAALGTFFVALLTQGPLLPGPRIFISLFLGGLYPAVVLTWLSSSVPAAEDVR